MERTNTATGNADAMRAHSQTPGGASGRRRPERRACLPMTSSIRLTAAIERANTTNAIGFCS
jgi:hypothetical protein